MEKTTYQRTVTEADTAAALDDSLPPAASTPFVLAIAEGACHKALSERLDADQLSVGARAEIDHLAPSPVGAELVATAELVGEEAPKFEFEVEVREGERTVARVRHVRAIVPRAAIFAALEPRA
jgi:predicted thioesterase